MAPPDVLRDARRVLRRCVRLLAASWASSETHRRGGPSAAPQAHKREALPSSHGGVHPSSAIRTWWLCSTWSTTRPSTWAPSCGSSESGGMPTTSARPTASGTPRILTKTPNGRRPMTVAVMRLPTGSASQVAGQAASQLDERILSPALSPDKRKRPGAVFASGHLGCSDLVVRGRVELPTFRFSGKPSTRSRWAHDGADQAQPSPASPDRLPRLSLSLALGHSQRE